MRVRESARGLRLVLALYWAENPRFFRLGMLWCGGFLLIITPEGLRDVDAITRSFDRATYDVASRCLVACHLATLFGRELTFSEAVIRPPVERWDLRTRRVVPVLLLSTIAVFAYYLPLAIRVYQTGRLGGELAEPSVFRALLQGFATSASVVVPITAVWCARTERGASKLILLAIAGGICALALFTGVRSLLLFALLGAAIAWVAPRRPSRRTAAIVVGVALLLAVMSAALRDTRVHGLREADVGEAVGAFSLEDFMLKERVVNTMAMAVDYTDRHGYKNGESTAAVLVFWVPRALWADKPTLMGYWLPRAYYYDGYFSEGFSAAQGFCGNAYMDFGLWGAVFLWFLGGLGFGLIERRVASLAAADRDARIILVAPLYGATFFAVRSFDTAFLTMTGILVFGMMVLIAAAVRRRSVPEVP